MKVFFDGRSDLYGAEFLKHYARLVQVRPGWQSYWESYDFTHALLPDDHPLLPALEQIGWRVIYQDETATLLAIWRNLSRLRMCYNRTSANLRRQSCLSVCPNAAVPED